MLDATGNMLRRREVRKRHRYEKKASLNRLIRPRKTRRIGHKKVLSWKTNSRVSWKPKDKDVLFVEGGTLKIQLCNSTNDFQNREEEDNANFIEIDTTRSFMDRFNYDKDIYKLESRSSTVTEENYFSEGKMDFYSFASLDTKQNAYGFDSQVEQKVIIVQSKEDKVNNHQLLTRGTSTKGNYARHQNNEYVPDLYSDSSGYFSSSSNSMDVIIGAPIASPTSDLGFVDNDVGSNTDLIDNLQMLNSDTAMEVIETDYTIFSPSIGRDSFIFNNDDFTKFNDYHMFENDSRLSCMVADIINTPELKMCPPVQKIYNPLSRWDQGPSSSTDESSSSSSSGSRTDTVYSGSIGSISDSDQSHSVFSIESPNGLGSRCTTPGSQEHSVIDLCSPYSITGDMDDMDSTRDLTTVLCRDIVDFHVLSYISKGAFGSVYKAADVDSGQIVAVKKVSLGVSLEDDRIPIAIYREIKTQWICDHPNVVKLESVASGKQLDMVYLIMEHLENDMYSVLKNVTQPLPMNEVKSLMTDLVTGVSYLHRNNIMHRDLKPSNLLLSTQGVLKIADFGLAREVLTERDDGGDDGNEEPTTDQCLTPIVVTLWYRAPEVLLGSKRYGKAVDMWSVGCIMSEFITCKPLFKGRSDLDQIKRIFEIRGRPCEQEWPEFGDLPGTRVCHFPKQNKLCLRKLMQCTDNVNVTDNAFDLIDRCLTLDPSKRVESRDALQHDWFTENELL